MHRSKVYQKAVERYKLSQYQVELLRTFIDSHESVVSILLSGNGNFQFAFSTSFHCEREPSVHTIRLC
jgi:hypothetical protein